MPTKIEAYSSKTKKWVDVENIKPGTFDRSLPHKVNNGTKLVIFSCDPHDTHTVIRRSTEIFPDPVAKVKETVPDQSGFQEIKKLNPGEFALLKIKTERGKTTSIRVTHLSDK